MRSLILIFLLGLVYSVTPATAERRVALVVGNGAYERATPLTNAVPDAEAVAKTLRSLDFEVVLGTDLDKIRMEGVLKRFIQSLAGADVSLFYYSGHAVQVDEQNHLIPTNAAIRTFAELALDTISIDTVLAYMRENTKVQLLFLDACRDNPFVDQVTRLARTDRNAAPGLARVSASAGSFVAFSTEPGKVAFDGRGRLSPFTGSFVSRAVEPRMEIRKLLTRVRTDVIEATSGQQIPWDNSSLLSDFYFIPPKAPPLFDKLAFVRTARSSGTAAVPLRLKPARQPEGGAVRVRLETPPREGALMLDARPLGTGAEFDGADLSELSYSPHQDGAVTDVFSFAVEDDWGNRESGFVTVAIEPSFANASVATAKPERIGLGRVQARAHSTVGLGPNLRLSAQLPQTSSAEARQSWIRLAAAPSSGQLMLGERRLDTGRSVTLAELPDISFRPAIGSEGRIDEAVFRTEEPTGGELRLRIEVDLHPCDRLAAHAFDTQAVTEGVPVEKLDAPKARDACEAAVREHPEVARFHSQLGRAYLALRRNAEALRAFERAAEMGHRRAAAVIGGFHLVGMLVPQDPDRARALYHHAAEAGDITAAQGLGQMYYEGRGVERDLVRARELFEKGVHVGSTAAMNSLGRMYSLGEGVEKDEAVAARFWRASAERGDVYGINNVGFVYLNGIGTRPDPQRALSYFKQAAELGHPQAPNNVGRLYAEGRGVRGDLTEAARWFRIGADRGDAWAALNLANLHRTGQGARLDLVATARFYARAAGLPQLEPAEQGRAMVAQLDRATKLKTMRGLLKSLKADPGEASPSQLIEKAAALATERGAAPTSQDLDDVLIAVAKAEWLALNARLDQF